jgi:hypothetical protein
LTDRDLVSVGEEPRQRSTHWVVQAKPSLARELQHNRRHERLGDAADPEAVNRTHLHARLFVRETDCGCPRLIPVTDEHENTRYSSGDDPLKLTCEPRRMLAATACNKEQSQQGPCAHAPSFVAGAWPRESASM